MGKGKNLSGFAVISLRFRLRRLRRGESRFQEPTVRSFPLFLRLIFAHLTPLPHLGFPLQIEAPLVLPGSESSISDIFLLGLLPCVLLSLLFFFNFLFFLIVEFRSFAEPLFWKISDLEKDRNGESVVFASSMFLCRIRVFFLHLHDSIWLISTRILDY